MPVLTDIFENSVINTYLRAQAFTPPATIYVGLLTAAPNEDGTGGTEVSGGSYARQPLTLGAPAAGQASNSAQVSFPAPTANWGTIIGSGIYTALSGGSLWVYNALAGGSIVVNSGGPPVVIPVASAVFGLD
jgi:hypothetical protein